MSPFKRFPELRRWQLDVLDHTQNVGELQSQKAHLMRFGELQKVSSGRAAEIGRNK